MLPRALMSNVRPDPNVANVDNVDDRAKATGDYRKHWQQTAG